MRPYPFPTIVLAALPIFVIAGCHAGPKYSPPAPPTIKAGDYKESTVQFKDEAGWKVASPHDAMLRGKWWEIYKEPELNSLEDELNINNQNIQRAFEQYMEARTLIAQARSQYWPMVTAVPSWSRSKTSGNLLNTPQANAGRTSSVWSFPLAVSWEPDLWGRIRNQVHEAQYGAQVSAADLANERLSEQASLAQYYFEVRGQDALSEILEETVAADEKALAFTQSQYDSGMGDYIAVVQAKSALESVRSTLIGLGVARSQYEHAIATLVGKTATDFVLPRKGLLRAAPPIPVGVPSELLERRPDVAAAERSLAQANAAIGIGYGAFFPSVSLSANGGFQSSTLKDAFEWPSRFWSVGPTISQTVFNGGLYRAELNQYKATYNADLATYRQTVLTAFQQVEDGLASVRLYSQQSLREQEAVASSQLALELERGRYDSGIDPYIDVVTSQLTLLSNRQTLATQKIAEMTASVQLIAVLGGGWDIAEMPTVKDVSAKSDKDMYTIKK